MNRRRFLQLTGGAVGTAGMVGAMPAVTLPGLIAQGAEIDPVIPCPVPPLRSTTTIIHINSGDSFSAAQVRALIEQLNEATRETGARITVLP